MEPQHIDFIIPFKDMCQDAISQLLSANLNSSDKMKPCDLIRLIKDLIEYSNFKYLRRENRRFEWKIELYDGNNDLFSKINSILLNLIIKMKLFVINFNDQKRIDNKWLGWHEDLLIKFEANDSSVNELNYNW